MFQRASVAKDINPICNGNSFDAVQTRFPGSPLKHTLTTPKVNYFVKSNNND
jgi:hypothetical protein